MPNEVLTVAQCYASDRFAEEHGVPSLTLMENAGRAVADEICKRWSPRRVGVLCGPGNNGGDGFVIARILKQRGWDVGVALYSVATLQTGTREEVTTRLKGDAAYMAGLWEQVVINPSGHFLEYCEIIVDALFGAGLSKPLVGPARSHVACMNAMEKPVIAVDVPSGLHGDIGHGFDDVVLQADLTVTFFRKKPAHVLMPGALSCGEVIVADIGIPEAAIASITPVLFENGPEIWGREYPWPQPMAHKYARGHCVVVSGNAHATGAARLAARGALRIGAGLVSVASPPDAVPINAAALTAVMVKPFDGAKGLIDLLSDKRFNAVVIGPGSGLGRETPELVAAVLSSAAAAVLDADALTSFHDQPATLFHLLREPAVLTPHEGEFERLFPGLLAKSQSKIEAAREAAKLASCTVVLKGPDTVIAARDGRAIINSCGVPTLATAGSGDVLSGLIGGLLAQRLDSFHAAAAAVWLHAKAAARFGPGLISEDLPELLPGTLAALKDELDGRTLHPPRSAR